MVVFGEQEQYKAGQLVQSEPDQPCGGGVNDHGFLRPSPSVLHHRDLPFYLRARADERGADAGGHVSADQYSGGAGGDVSTAACRREQIEADITDTFERFFTLGSGIDHMESRSMAGVSLIKIYFQAGTDANADVTQISNLAMADLRRLPQGTLPPVVMKVDASSLPVCLLTVSGEGLNETQLHDYLQFQIRNQIAGVPGATVPPPYGGSYRQIMVYVDPLKLQAHQLSPMDVVRATDAIESDFAGGRCAHRADGLQHLHQRAGAERRRR